MQKIIKKFNKINILVIGDVMLDTWIQGKVNRISPEADVPIVLGKKIDYALGGAANCAANIRSLNGKVDLFGMIGQDDAGQKLKELLKKQKIPIGNLITNQKPTIQKIRLCGERNQVARLDWEEADNIDKIIENKILKKVHKKISKINLIIFSDYNKGLLTKKLTQTIIKEARRKKIPIIADAKPTNLEKFIGVNLITPNLKEAGEMSDLESKNTNKKVEEMAKIIRKKTQSDIIITRGAKGMTVYNGQAHHIPTRAKSVYEVAGAGDTVIAALGLCIALRESLEISAKIANIAAGIAVSKHGTTTVSQEELLNNL